MLIVLIAAGALLSGPAGFGPGEPQSSEAAFLSEVKKLLAPNPDFFDLFGSSVAVSGDTAIVGALSDDDGGGTAGAAYVFQRNQGGADNWGLVKKLLASDAEANDQFGTSVAISGDIAVVSAHFEDTEGANAGAAYVFQRDQGGTDNWGQVKKLTASDAQAGDRFGLSVAVSGDTAVVGAPLEDAEAADAGAAYVFQRDQGGTDNWGQVKKLLSSDAQTEDLFGLRVAVSGDTAVVGAYLEGGGGGLSGDGAAYVFQRDEGGADNWGEVKKLTASDAQLDDLFGCSVAVSGDTAVVGAQGAAYVFQRNEGDTDNWGEVMKLTASDAQDLEFFGRRVAVSGDTAVVGALGQNTGLFAGAAYVFQRDQGGAGNWGEVTKLTGSDAGADEEFGFSVAVSGDTIVVGARLEDAEGSSAGAAYVFQRAQGGADNWSEVTKLTASDAAAGDLFGFSVAVGGDTAVVGAYHEDAGGIDAGAAYVFQRDEGGVDNWGEVAKLTASDAQAEDSFGVSVAVTSNTTVVGAYTEDAEGTDAGAAYVFERE
ncbi:MAG: hypothetical protein IIB21_06830 [Chloroflexi bacterium]|nr:hypothetical protein [Chloroflexota bacterium]